MSALAGPRNTPQLGELLMVREAKVKATQVIYKGALVVFDTSGYLTPGGVATTMKAAGRADTGTSPKLDTTGVASGAISIRVDVGVFRWNNSTSTDEITITELGKDVYILDDQTVAKTDGTGARSIAGKVELVDAQGVWVRTGL